MYVYCTDAVERAAGGYGLGENLANLILRLEQGESTLLQQLFDIRYPYWKRNLRHNIRLLGELRWLDRVPIFVLFGLWMRGGHEYKKFLAQRETSHYQNWVLSPVSDQTLREWLEEQWQQEEEDEPRADLDLPSELEGWLHFLFVREHRERLVLESHEWIKQMLELSQEQKRQVCEMVQAIVDDVEGVRYQRLPDFYQGAAVKCWQQETVHLVLSYVQVKEHPKRFPFLIGVYDYSPPQRERFQLGRITDLFGWGAQNPDILKQCLPLETWKRYAYRAYPDYMVADEEIWLEMQAEVESNFALSMEEETILQEKAMPLLINGRAGSGKSLMLYYRFADYCSYYLTTGRYQAPAYQPLFLTYSSTLVEQAKHKVGKILRVNHHYRAEQEFSKEDIRRCQGFFSTFQDYLLSCLPPERQERYLPEKYVNFYQFKKRYRNNPRIDAEIAWHTIRTLIKGYNVNGYLEPEDYPELPRRDRSVTQEVFQDVYHNIWLGYHAGYHALTTYEGYWDDLDLARDVLENGTIQPIYPVIFCDEVQDFTPVELSIILSSSPWGKFILGPWVRSLPYAFAGDPLQTINPTGFRWSILKRYLYEHIHSFLLPEHPFQVPDIQELRNNYRCHPHITRVSNLVNLWRRVLLHDTQIKPQEPWRTLAEGTTAQIAIHLTQDELSRMIDSGTGTLCILPCSVGEELDYIKCDQDLKEIFADDLSKNRKPAVLQTVTSVKGMEFEEIILYKFGEYYRENFPKNLNCYPVGNIPFELQYFLNQLYVGITRPIKRLVIVDTEAGNQHFWQGALNIKFWLDQLPQNHQEQWPDELLANPVPYIAPPPDPDADTEKIRRKIRRIAFEFLKAGVNNQDPQRLRDAQVFAKKANDKQLVQECSVWIAKIKGRYIEAGEQFIKMPALALEWLSPKREAWECFWEGQAWSQLKQYSAEFAQVPDIPDYSPLVDLMVARQMPTDPLVNHVIRVRDWLTPDVSPKRWDKTWKAALEGFFEALDSVLKKLEGIFPDGVERKQFLEATYKAWTRSLTFLGQTQQQNYTAVLKDGLGKLKEWSLLVRILIYRRDWKAILQTVQAHPQAWVREHDAQLVAALEQNPRILREWTTLEKEVHEKLLKTAEKAFENQRKTEHSLYYKVKSELTEPPEKVKWLVKDGQYKVVIRLWKQAGKSLKSDWQEYTGAIIASLRHLEEWTLLLQVLIQLHSWEEVLQTVQAHPQAWVREHDAQLVAALEQNPSILSGWKTLGHRAEFFLSEVVAVWEQQGKTEHSLYYQVKSELTQPPEKVKWLAKDGQHEAVIRLWNDAGKPLQWQWQEYTDVIITSLRHLEEWTLLLQVLIQLRSWEELLQTVEAHPRAWLRGHDYELVATLARDHQTNWQKQVQRVPKLLAFMGTVLTSVEVELGWLPSRAQELGLGYERLSLYKEALALYGRFTNYGAKGYANLSKEQRDWQVIARQRWLLVNKKYQEVLQRLGQPWESLEEEFQKNQTCWDECIPEAEPELPAWNPWSTPFVATFSPLQGWIIQKGQHCSDVEDRDVNAAQISLT